METALRQAIKAIEEKKEQLKLNDVGSIISRSAYIKTLVILQSLIPTEKEQIEKAYQNGHEETRCEIWDGIDKEYILSFSSEQYYTQTYQSK